MTFTGSSSLHFAGNNQLSALAFVDESISFNVASMPAGGIYYGFAVTGTLVGEVDLVWQTGSSGRVRLSILPPSSFGAGTYTGSVDVHMCLDSACAQPLQGSPFTIDLTLEVAGLPTPNTSVHWSQSFMTGAELTTSETRAPHLTLRISVSSLPHTGLYLRRTALTGNVVTGVVFGEPTFTSTVGSAYGQYDVTLKPPAALGSGIFTDAVMFQACYDPGCASVVPGSTFTFSTDLLIPATEGLEFTRRTLASSPRAHDVAWSPASQSLYLAQTLGITPQITKVDPVTMATGPSVALPFGDLRHLKIAADGSRLYVASRSQPYVLRLALPALTPEVQIPLGQFSQSTPNVANDLEIVPDQPRSVVIAVGHGGSHGGVVVYDDSTARPDKLPTNPQQAFELARWLVPAATPGVFISQSFGQSFPQVNEIEQLQVGPTGITRVGSATFALGIGIGDKPQRVGNMLFTHTGRVLDAVSGEQLGLLPLFNGTSEYAHAIVADEARGLLFVWATVRQRDYILSYDAATRELLALAPVVAGPLNPGIGDRRMTLWGTEGLAIAWGDQFIVLSGPFFSTYRGEPTM